LAGKQKTEIDLYELREFLKTKLPSYMVPSAFVEMKALPLTGSGKVDRKALPAPVGGRRTEKVYQAPESRVEQIIAKMWQEVLRIEKVGVHDNFFDLGGHSLSLARVRNKLQGYFQKEIPIAEMFERPTVRALAELLLEQRKESPSFDRIRERAMKQKEMLKSRRQALSRREKDK
jgi:acyl carrier protein